MSISTFAELIAPIAPRDFLATYFGKKPLHIKGGRDKFASVLTWSGLNDMLNLSGLWSAKSLGLFVDGEKVPPQQYCAPALNRDGQQVMQPLPDRVAEFLRGGAALVCDEVDNVAPGIGAVAAAIERELVGKVQSNLYCTWAGRQAFRSHFDVHDVFALHLEGVKSWKVYEGRADHPINHPAFQRLGQAHHDRARGAVAMEVKMEAGDLLYLPRGQYHDALASSDGSIHVTMSTTFPIGLDLITLLFEAAIGDSLFRQNLPRAGDDAAFSAHVNALADRLAQMAKSPEALKAFSAFRRGYRYPRGNFALPKREPRGN
jgi:ribosomal protein L16 Arg81 hydroxylase